MCVCAFQSQKKTGSSVHHFKFLPPGMTLHLRLAKCDTQQVFVYNTGNGKNKKKSHYLLNSHHDLDNYLLDT